jgi:hypothetical protein
MIAIIIHEISGLSRAKAGTGTTCLSAERTSPRFCVFPVIGTRGWVLCNLKFFCGRDVWPESVFAVQKRCYQLFNALTPALFSPNSLSAKAIC